MNTDFIVGGYYLSQAKSGEEWAAQKPLLPKKFWTVDGYLCNLYPDLWGWSWTGISEEEKQAVRTRLRMTEEAYGEMQKWVEDKFNSGHIGWGGVFFNRDSAEEFHRRTTQSVPDLKLLSIALHPDYVEELLAFNRPKREKNEGESGVYTMLSKGKMLSEGATMRGYEVLGYDCGSFNSFAVNHLENEYCGNLRLSLNAQGLFDKYGDALKAARYTQLPTTGAEPGLWLPWLVSEYYLR